MAGALYDPERGFYAAGKAGIGRRGDFFTNVTVGPLFGWLLARQFEEMWVRMGRPGVFTIMEQGAHDGAFANDVLGAVGREFAEAVAYGIVEPSAVLRARQQSAIRNRRSAIEWLPKLEPFTGVHFSNELVDAFPVHLVVWRDGEWRERKVDGGAFVDGPLSSDALRERLDFLAPPEIEGYTTEVCLDALAWVDEVAANLTRGYALVVDYGWPRALYYSSERTQGTLAAYRAHRRVDDLLADPGEQDLTAHVEFTSLAERAGERGLATLGFTDQHHFMVGIGRHAMERADAAERRAFQTLMHPGLMGTAFKYLCLGRGVPTKPPLSGFEFGRREL